MTDVRLTATNPDDSSVVPVACNAKGELKLEEPTLAVDVYVAKSGDNMTGDLTFRTAGGDTVTTLSAADGNAAFAKGAFNVSGSNGTVSWNQPAGYFHFYGQRSNTVTSALTSDGQLRLGGDDPTNEANANILLKGADGSATFTGDVVVGSRNKQWMIVESNGLAHLVEQTPVLSVSAADLPDDEPASKYPELRNIPQELDLIEKALGEVMEKLRMNPPSGWPVWDGSDEN